MNGTLITVLCLLGYLLVGLAGTWLALPKVWRSAWDTYPRDGYARQSMVLWYATGTLLVWPLVGLFIAWFELIDSRDPGPGTSKKE